MSYQCKPATPPYAVAVYEAVRVLLLQGHFARLEKRLRALLKEATDAAG